MAFEFKSGPAKPALSGTVRTLRERVDSGDKPTAAKSVGSGTIKIFMEGPSNYYVEDSYRVRQLLLEFSIEP